ncbi:MAG: hypothetical protein J6J42_03355 [Lachnospiraceae bacterium]|nr:hypothetical protein [Lachnospiraceae bacterium]
MSKDEFEMIMNALDKLDRSIDSVNERIEELGKSFEEKKEEIIEFLKGQEDALLAERVFNFAMNDEVGKHTKEKFWQQGECFGKLDGVVL